MNGSVDLTKDKYLLSNARDKTHKGRFVNKNGLLSHLFHQRRKDNIPFQGEKPILVSKTKPSRENPPFSHTSIKTWLGIIGCVFIFYAFGFELEKSIFLWLVEFLLGLILILLSSLHTKDIQECIRMIYKIDNCNSTSHEEQQSNNSHFMGEVEK